MQFVYFSSRQSSDLLLAPLGALPRDVSVPAQVLGRLPRKAVATRTAAPAAYHTLQAARQAGRQQ